MEELRACGQKIMGSCKGGSTVIPERPQETRTKTTKVGISPRFRSLNVIHYRRL